MVAIFMTHSGMLHLDSILCMFLEYKGGMNDGTR